MKPEIKPYGSDHPLRILLVGNNPPELSHMREMLQQIPGYRVISEIAFDVRSAWQRLMRFAPHFILIDDNIGRKELAEAVQRLSSRRRTRNVPLVVLKNSNYSESVATSSALDYLLKHNLSATALYVAVKNALKFQQARKYLEQAYARRRKQLLRFIV